MFTKRVILLIAFLFCLQTNAQQNPNTLPTQGKVGINTTTPIAEIDIIGDLTIGGYQKHIIHTQYWLEEPGSDFLAIAHMLGNNQVENFGQPDWPNSWHFYTSGTVEKRIDSPEKIAFKVRNTSNWQNAEENNYVNTHDVFRVYGSGKVYATEVEVLLASNFPDYVFDDQYNLMSLDSLTTFINKKKRIPGFKSSKEYREAGKLNVGELQLKQQEKIEELYLYILRMHKKIDSLENKLNERE
jgi:hypothetical protein